MILYTQIHLIQCWVDSIGKHHSICRIITVPSRWTSSKEFVAKRELMQSPDLGQTVHAVGAGDGTYKKGNKVQFNWSGYGLRP
jgi:hypothetical protein